jgi:hypothetical protein
MPVSWFRLLPGVGAEGRNCEAQKLLFLGPGKRHEQAGFGSPVAGSVMRPGLWGARSIQAGFLLGVIRHGMGEWEWLLKRMNSSRS